MVITVPATLLEFSYPLSTSINNIRSVEIWEGSSHGRHGIGPGHALPDRWLFLADLIVQCGVVDWWLLMCVRSDGFQ